MWNGQRSLRHVMAGQLACFTKFALDLSNAAPQRSPLEMCSHRSVEQTGRLEDLGDRTRKQRRASRPCAVTYSADRSGASAADPYAPPVAKKRRGSAKIRPARARAAGLRPTSKSVVLRLRSAGASPKTGRTPLNGAVTPTPRRSWRATLRRRRVCTCERRAPFDHPRACGKQFQRNSQHARRIIATRWGTKGSRPLWAGPPDSGASKLRW